jgi:hypothetical protein
VIKLKPQLKPHEAPPPDYYAANLRHLFSHVQDFYEDLLTTEEAGYLHAFLSASDDAQRLYARLLGRKGPWIRIDKLNYQEIADLPAAITALEAIGLAEVNARAPAETLLGLLTQTERKAAFAEVTGRKKADWIIDCLSRHEDERIRRVLAGQYAWINLRRYRLVRLIQLLFFGDDRQDTSTFVLQDLGLMRFEAYPLMRSERLFSDRAALDRYQRLRRLDRLCHRLDEALGLDGWLAEALTVSAGNRQEQRQRDRTLNRLGQQFERQGDFDRALDCYGRSRMHPARERRARILKKLEDEAGSQGLIERIASTPRCAEEVDFARRFGKRARRQEEAVTVVPLAQPVQHIEAYAAERIGSSGAFVFHLENALPRSLAGLAYWDQIFEPLPGAFTNPFQTGPLDLFWPDFAEARADAIAARSHALAVPGAMQQALAETYEAKAGVANRMVSWRHFDATVLEVLLRYVPETALLALAQHVIRWPYRTRNGFPDLTVVYGPGNFEFVEVKGPTDQLQPGQRVWLSALEQLDLPARVLKFKAC